MQNAKDSFYIALRNRLQALNAARVVTIRGLQRPGILVEEAEAPLAELLNDVFLVRWKGLATQTVLPLALAVMECEIVYATSGSQANAGLDRGRAMTEMDCELLHCTAPLCTPKMDYAVTPAAPLATDVFWTSPVFAPLSIVRDRLLRVASLQVFAFEEATEL